MKRGKKIAISTALTIWIILLAFTLYYVYGFYVAISKPVPVSEVYSEDKVVLDGSSITMEDGDVVSFDSDGNDYSLKIYSVEPGMARFVVNNFLYFDMDAGREKRVDLDGDSYYDLLIRLRSIQGDEATLALTQISEERSFGSGFNDAVDRLSDESGNQSKVVILILLLFAMVLLAYVTKEYIIPTIEDRRRMSRKSEMETFNDLRDKFEEFRDDGDRDKAQKVFDKAKHLHRYMEDEDKEKTKKAIQEMANYLK